MSVLYCLIAGAVIAAALIGLDLWRDRREQRRKRDDEPAWVHAGDGTSSDWRGESR